LFYCAAPAVAAPVKPAAVAPARTLQRLSEATEHFRAGRYAEARALFDQVLAQDRAVPDRATIAFNAAVSSYALEEYADALRRFEAVLRAFPELAELARVNAGFAALRLGDLNAAQTYAEPECQQADVEARRQQLVQELSHEREARRQREVGQLIDAGFDAVAQQRWPAARASFQRAIALAPAGARADLADAHYGLALVDTADGEWARAELHFEESLAHRPGDARTLLALGRAAEAASDVSRAELAYDSALKLPLQPAQVEDTERSLRRLYPLPLTGATAFGSFAAGVDGNATQSGSADVVATSAGQSRASAYLSGLLDLGWMFRASRRAALGLNYSGDLLALLATGVSDLSLQSHELVGRVQWAPNPEIRLRLDAGAAYVLTGLDPMLAFEWDGVLALAADLATGQHSRARLQLGERLVRASEFTYLDGHRLQLLASELWSFGPWEFSLQTLLRYNAAGTQKLELLPNEYAACSPNCDRRGYGNPQSYWSPGVGAGAAWQATSALRFSASGRGEYRGYLDASGIPGVRASQQNREDWRWRGQLGGELSLDARHQLNLTLQQTLLVSVSNVAYDARDAVHQYDYGDRNFVQPTTELGISASLP
jgi:tetratricopeptide (TPR) repeat protein